jgi:hypothetical protein
MTDAISWKQRFDILDDGQLWMDALNDRDLTSQTHDENKAREVVAKIRSHYFSALQQLHRRMNSELN